MLKLMRCALLDSMASERCVPLMLLFGQAAGLKLKVLVSSGEPLTVELVQSLRIVLPPATVILNIYGCTEVAADAASCEASREAQSRLKGPLWPGNSGKQAAAAQASR